MSLVERHPGVGVHQMRTVHESHADDRYLFCSDGLSELARGQAGDVGYAIAPWAAKQLGPDHVDWCRRAGAFQLDRPDPR